MRQRGWLLRNKREAPEKTIAKGALLLDIPSGRAFLRGEDLLLSPLEFYVLLYLAQHEGSMVAPEALHDEVWKQPNHNGVSEVKTTVPRLRKK